MCCLSSSLPYLGSSPSSLRRNSSVGDSTSNPLPSTIVPSKNISNPTDANARIARLAPLVRRQFNLVEKRDMIPLAEFNDTIAGEYK